MGILQADLAANATGGMILKLFLVNYRAGQSARTGSAGRKALLFPLRVVTSFAHRCLELMLGCSIPFSVRLGQGVRWMHNANGVFITRDAVIGEGCTILHQVTIGSNLREGDDRRAPVLGRHVFVGAGAKLIGGVVVGDRAKIGAQALVVGEVPADAIVRAPEGVIEKKTASD